MKNLYLILLVIIFLSCKNENKLKIKKSSKRVTKIEEVQKTELEENFIDSTRIGVKGKFKIDLKKFRSKDSVYVEIKLFEKQKSEWIIVQNLEFLKDGILSCDPEISDFNNDGLNDFTFQSAVAGRGANIIRKLLIFDKKKSNLIFIKNSENFPNMRYNRELDCIDAFRVFGGSNSAFAKIEKDSLWEFANVNLFNDTIKITVIDKKGNEKLLKNEKYKDGSFHRYKNYKPLIEYKDTK